MHSSSFVEPAMPKDFPETLALAPADAVTLVALIPQAIDWAERQGAVALRTGTPLPASGIVVARSVGVAHPERIRLNVVSELPRPDDPGLWHALADGWAERVGLTLGHGIYLVRGHVEAQLFRHECRHVHQVEQAGSIAAFIDRYFREYSRWGYWDMPLERDARGA